MKKVNHFTKHSTMHDIIIMKDDDFAYIQKVTKRTKKVTNEVMITHQDIEKKAKKYLSDGYVDTMK